MGYTTTFKGKFNLNRPLAPEHKAYLHAFASTRRMQRDPLKTALRQDPVREAVGLPVGDEGGYFVGANGFRGQESPVDSAFGSPVGPDVIDYNRAPQGQPGLWCRWVPTADGAGIKWDGGEKFYDYIEWLTYIIDHFLRPWGYTLNGVVKWKGEDRKDRGEIVVADNEVSYPYAR